MYDYRLKTIKANVKSTNNKDRIPVVSEQAIWRLTCPH